MGTPRRVWTSPRGARPPLMRCRKPRWAWDPLHGVWGPPEGYRPPPEGCENPPGEDNAHEDGESTSTAPRGHLVCTCTESTDRAGGEQQHGDAGMHRCTPRQPLLGGARGGGGSYFKLKKGNRLVKLTDGSGSASRKGAPLVFAVLCLRGCATVPWQPSLLRCRRSASSTASTLQGFPSGNESLRAWLRALRVPLSSPRCQEVIVQRFLIVSYPRGGSRAEQSTEQLCPPRPAARRSRWLVGSSRLGRNTR